jgi:diguanylate cyclase (GGDEF)-like protein
LPFVPRDAPVDEILRLARDLCLGVGAFFATGGGTVFSNMSDVMQPEDAENRVATLARTCLTHPSARGTDLFWSAEPSDESGSPPPEFSLACVVAPVWSGPEWLGLLGVVDVWLPELDDEQRSGLLALAAGLAEQASGEQRERAASAAAFEGLAESVASVAAEAALGAPVDRAAAGSGAAPREEGTGEPFLGEILDNLPDGLVVTRADGTIVLVNQTFSAMTGLPMDGVLGEDVTIVLGTGQRAWGEERSGPDAAADTDGGRELWLQGLLAQPEPGRQIVVDGPSGAGSSFDAAGKRFDSRFAGDCYVTLVRVTDDAKAGLDSQAGGIQELLDHIEDGIMCCDAAGTVVIANRAARRLQGLGDDQLRVGEPFPSATRLRTPEGHQLSVDEHPIIRSMLDDVPITTEFLLGEDDVVHVSISSHPLRVDGGDGAIAVLRDVTAERERQAHLTHYALHDPLTGVANRYLLIDALGRMLDGLARRGGSVSLIYLDLDRFKEINDRHGHDTGDELLRAVARRLERAVRGEDVVARLGGDEFVVAHATTDHLSDGDAVVARLRKVLSAPYRFGNLVLDVGASVGWVSTSSGGETPESLISRADRAMYDHKNRRRTGGGQP